MVYPVGVNPRRCGRRDRGTWRQALRNLVSPRLAEDAPFRGLTNTQLVLMMAWPEAASGDQPSIVDAAINALPGVASVRTRVFEPTVMWTERCG